MLGLRRAEIEAALARISGESVGEVLTLRILLEQLDVGIQNARTVQALAAATVADKESGLAEAEKRREALERIVTPRQEEARALERLAERKQEDEVALTRHRLGGGWRP